MSGASSPAVAPRGLFVSARIIIVVWAGPAVSLALPFFVGPPAAARLAPSVAGWSAVPRPKGCARSPKTLALAADLFCAARHDPSPRLARYDEHARQRVIPANYDSSKNGVTPEAPSGV